MDGYKNYIRVNEAGIIVHGFSDAFEQPQDGDILILEDGPRHFNQVWPEPLTNERGQYRYKWNGTEMVERSQQEFDEEWAARPPAPETDKEKIDRLEKEKAALERRVGEIDKSLIDFQTFYFDKNPGDA